ncbi:ABC transporter permease [Thermogladius sp.]|uniref:ABC transporter permease n=1 Tax=Thermogladius sp. TaxID=2023064 RepID=UPI003D13E253
MLILVFFIFIPFSVSLYYSLSDQSGSSLTLSNFIRIYSDRSYLDAIRNSIVISLESAVLSTLFGSLLAYAFTFLSPTVRDIIRSVLLLPIIYPGLVIAFSLVILFGSSGVVTSILLKYFGVYLPGIFDVRSYNGLILAYQSFLVGFTSITLSGVFLSLDRSIIEASRSLGADVFQTIFRVVLPIVAPGLIAAFIQAFIIAISGYGTALALVGGGGNLITLRIIMLISDVEYQPHLASALAMNIAIITIPLALVYNRLLKKVVGGVV